MHEKGNGRGRRVVSIRKKDGREIASERESVPRRVASGKREDARAGGAVADEGTEHEEHLRLNFVCF